MSSILRRHVQIDAPPATLQHEAKTDEVLEISAEDSVPKLCGMPMKWVSLLALTFQTSWQVIVIKFARSGGGQYLNTSVVFFAEVLKTLISIALLSRSEGGFSPALNTLKQQFTNKPLSTLRFCVPGLAYTIMNNLVFLSLDKLSAAVQQVTYQLKILTAAVLAVVMLGKRIDFVQWCSLILLVAGVSLVQWPRQPTGAAVQFELALDTDAVVGLVAVVSAAFMGGFAGVYMEMVLKQKDASIWLRNAQLGIFGAVTALIAAFVNDGQRIRDDGLLQGYSWRTLAAIFTLATGGLLVAVVIKYADNILRQFSTALSIIITSIFSAVVLEDLVPDSLFVVGAFIAISSTFLYNLGLPRWVTGVAS
mmetsp:Transcript_65125/g.167998  ORF Transcript_65125/g.167998 Transcript_65125/m.167998 type:complete len:364 (+) Transcript_65125:109-1200(+)